MSSGGGEQVSGLLRQAADGDPQAQAQVFDLLYADLATLARIRLSRAPRVTMADTGALVHECWLRMRQAGATHFEDHGHFMAYAARAMRSVVTDMVRRSTTQRNGGDVLQVTFDTAEVGAVPDQGADVIRLNDALDELAALDRRLAQVVEMRFFAGLSGQEIAEALGVTERTVERDWKKARAFLGFALKR